MSHDAMSIDDCSCDECALHRAERNYEEMSMTNETATPTQTLNVEIPVPIEEIVSVLCSGIEGGRYGIGYWGKYVHGEVPDGFSRASFNEAHPKLRCYTTAQIAPFAGGELVLSEYYEDGHAPDVEHRIDLSAIRRGLVLMAAKHPKHFGDLLSGQSDANTGDVLIQLCALGEIRYG